MISRARRAGASALTWLYVAATAVAAFLWLTYRIVHHMPRASWLETGFGLLNVPVTPSLVSAIGLGLIAAGLLHRKRLALVAVGVFQAAGIVWTAADLVNLAAGKTLAPDGRDVESVPLIIGSSIVMTSRSGTQAKSTTNRPTGCWRRTFQPSTAPPRKV